MAVVLFLFRRRHPSSGGIRQQAWARGTLSHVVLPTFIHKNIDVERDAPPHRQITRQLCILRDGWRLQSRTLGCGGKLKSRAVSRVTVSGVSAHVEDVGRGGSEAGYHHAGGSGPRRRVAQLLLLLWAHIVGGNEQRHKYIFQLSGVRLHKPITAATFENKNTSFSAY